MDDTDQLPTEDDFEDVPEIYPGPDGSYPMPERLAGLRVKAMGKASRAEAWSVRVLRGDRVIMEWTISARARLYWGARDPLDVVIGPASSPVRLVVEGATVPIEVKARAV